MLILVCMTALFGCGQEKGQAYFSATVLELNDGSVRVKCTNSYNSGISVHAEVIVSTDVVAANGVPELAVGNPIRVVFNGEILESNPLQLGTVFAIYLLDENGAVISDSGEF